MIRLIKPYIRFSDIENDFKEIFESGILTKGKYSQKLPEMICAYTGAKYAFNTTSATTALAACLEILDIGYGDEVVVSDFSFPATANVVEARGATPVFADVDTDTFNMLPEALESRITANTKAVIFVCALGNPDGLDRIAEICRKNHIVLINDAACAIGSSIHHQKVGSIADLACFSFHPRKLLTAGEGGAITTNNAEYAGKLQIKLAHGAAVKDGQMDFVTYGYNYRLPELQCAMLIHQIQQLDAIVRQRIAIQRQYAEYLIPAGYHPQTHGEHVTHNMQSVVFTVPESVNRDSLIVRLRAADIESTIGTYCLSNGAYYKKKYNDVQKNALWLEQNTITLPCYEDLSAEDIARVMLT
jgi:dTDP-4-amino-4,6-dideoxygalactose transaminase